MEFVKLEKQDSGIAILTVSKPKALNALSSQVLKDIDQAINQVQEDSSLRCLVITGDGDKAFVAGADIKEIDSLNTDTASEFADFGQKVFSRFESLDIPVIAAVNGFALGGGLELAMSCDFIYASSSAKFGLPECTLGLMPGFGGSVRLARKVGPSRAKQMTFTGDMISAEDAMAFGLVNHVSEPETLMDDVLKTAKTIGKRAPLALAKIKRTIEQTYGMATSDAMAVEKQNFADLFASEDCKEGTQAFIEKRKPTFLGK